MRALDTIFTALFVVLMVLAMAAAFKFLICYLVGA